MDLEKTYRVLIADDHVVVRRGVRAMLETLPSVEICGEASDGNQTMHYIKSEKPDLLVLDLTMPEMNGLDVARQIHALRPQLPVVLASGYGGSLTDEDLRKAGIVELLQKPVSLPLLAAMIHRLLPAPGPGAKDGQTKPPPS